MFSKLFGGNQGRYKNGDSIIEYDKKFEHSCLNEMDYIVNCDAVSPRCGDECYLISTTWVKRWMEYAKGHKMLKSVGPIDNNHLVENNKTRIDIESKTDFRCVNKMMWEYLFRGYGGGPVIGFYIPVGMSESELKGKLWLEHIVITQVPIVLDPNSRETLELVLPPPFDMGYRDDVSQQQHDKEHDNLAQAHVINILHQQEGKSKLKAATLMDEEKKSYAAKSIVLALKINSKKLEARTKMISAAKILSSSSDHDQEDIEIFEKMQKEGASLYLQISLGRLYLQRRSRKLAEEQLRLREEGAVLILQSFWRTKSAKRKRAKLNRERSMFLAARLIQKRVRLRNAKQKSFSLRETLTKNRACSKIQRAYRTLKARDKFSDMLNSFHPHTILATMHSAKITSSAVAYAYPHERYVVATVFSVDSRAKGLSESSQGVATGLKGAKKRRQSFVTTNPSDSDNMTMLSFHRSAKAEMGNVANYCEWKKPKLHSTEGNQCFMTNASPSSVLVFSVFEKHTFLGQAMVDVKDYSSRLYAGETVLLKDIPMNTKGAIPVHDALLGKEIVRVPHNFGNLKTGLLTLSIQLPLLTRSMCGWVHRASSTFLHGGEFKRRWMIMIEKTLYCYEDPYTLNNSKGELDMTQIFHVNLNKADKSLVIQYGVQGKSSWTIKWDEDEAQHLSAMWHRKLKRNCPAGVVVPEITRKLKKKNSSL